MKIITEQPIFDPRTETFLFQKVGVTVTREDVHKYEREQWKKLFEYFNKQENIKNIVKSLVTEINP